MVPSRQRFTVALWSRADFDHRLDAIRRAQRASQGRGDGKAGHGERLREAFAQRGGRSWMSLVELAGQVLE